MYPQQVHSFLRQFFIENHCEVVHDSDDALTVQLTIDIDKRIMNRPYYWQYVEATNSEPNPAQVTFITDQNKLSGNRQGENVHFGSQRLSQLFQVTKEQGAFVKMYEQVNSAEVQAVLTPWLSVNYKISYCSDRTKEMLYSFGMNLLTGQIEENFHESLYGVELAPNMSEAAFHVQYIIKPSRALDRLDAAIEAVISQDDHTWAEESAKRWERDMRVLEYFYEGIDNKPESYEIEKQALEERYDAKIKVEIINGGLFYLK
ncbi:YqhG family protein [Solibacillus sp. CAU 1738]|uniref:YqhG family protein n=1 Tax=Solibacillus sp. CAU 1738 TaxID=3140363 RepID=UPI0032605789